MAFNAFVPSFDPAPVRRIVPRDASEERVGIRALSRNETDAEPRSEPMSTLRTFLPMCTAVFALVACGGGGAGGSNVVDVEGNTEPGPAGEGFADVGGVGDMADGGGGVTMENIDAEADAMESDVIGPVDGTGAVEASSGIDAEAEVDDMLVVGTLASELLGGRVSIDYPDDFGVISPPTTFDPEIDDVQLLSFASNAEAIDENDGLIDDLITCFVSITTTSFDDVDAFVDSLPFNDAGSGVTVVSQEVVDVNGENALEILASLVVDASAEIAPFDASSLNRYYFFGAERTSFGRAFAVSAACVFAVNGFTRTEPRARRVLDTIRIE